LLGFGVLSFLLAAGGSVPDHPLTTSRWGGQEHRNERQERGVECGGVGGGWDGRRRERRRRWIKERRREEEEGETRGKAEQSDEQGESGSEARTRSAP
jgi:hypothetical protein